MNRLKIGIVGAGNIADFVTTRARPSEKVVVSAIASRRKESATIFAQKHGIEQVFETWQQLCQSKDVDIVYVATPTSVKEEIAIFAASHGKHILVDKPFTTAESVRRIASEASKMGVAFMDATHFSHHARTEQLRNEIEDQIGQLVGVRSTFFAPLDDTNNIRFDTSKEPMGALGDLAWYNMRALVEFSPFVVDDMTASVSYRTLPETNAIKGGSGLLHVGSGQTVTFDFGFDASTLTMDLQLIGQKGIIWLDDYIHDWYHFGDGIPSHQDGYWLKSGAATPNEYSYVKSQAQTPQCQLMLDNLALSICENNQTSWQHYADKALATQKLLDLCFDKK